jgi:hypothetical protein
VIVLFFTCLCINLDLVGSEVGDIEVALGIEGESGGTIHGSESGGAEKRAHRHCEQLGTDVHWKTPGLGWERGGAGRLALSLLSGKSGRIPSRVCAFAIRDLAMISAERLKI